MRKNFLHNQKTILLYTIYIINYRWLSSYLLERNFTIMIID